MGLEHATDNHELNITGVTFIGYSLLLLFSFTGLCFYNLRNLTLVNGNKFKWKSL